MSNDELVMHYICFYTAIYCLLNYSVMHYLNPLTFHLLKDAVHWTDAYHVTT